MKQTDIDKLVTEILAIEAEEAKQAGALGYMARALVQATLPHKKVSGSEFTRRNGAFVLSILAPSKIGLPYGSIPRLLTAWLTTETVIKQNRTLCLGNTLSSFMREIDLIPTGGRWGSITRLKDQMQRLFTSSISCYYESSNKGSERGFRVADSHDLWWHPQSSNQSTLFESTVTLSENFFNEIINNPVPIDMRALKALKRSPMALDIYFWLTYRMSYLNKQTKIPWPVLQSQFGADYERSRDFKRYFLRQLRSVHAVYPKAKLEINEDVIILKPSKPHVPTQKPCGIKELSTHKLSR